MGLAVVGAGVGRTGTYSLKFALERLLGGPCHHMYEVLAHPDQEIPVWTRAVHGKRVRWKRFFQGYRASVDWPSAAFWPELSRAFPDSIVLLSVRDPDDWYRSASETIFQLFEAGPPAIAPWMAVMRELLGHRFSDAFDDREAMVAAFKRHADRVRTEVPAHRLLEWSLGDGWEPICEKLGLPVPDEPFPYTNTTEEFRAFNLST